MASLDPKWAGGRPRRITTEDETFIVKTARARPESVGLPFTRWSIRKLVAYLADNADAARRDRARAPARAARRRRRHLPAHQDLEGVERPAKRREARPHRRGARRITPTRCLRLRRVRSPRPPPDRRLDAGANSGSPSDCGRTTTRTAGVRQFHGCYSVADDVLFGACARRKGADEHPRRDQVLIRRNGPRRTRIYVILDNLSAHKGKKIRELVREAQRRALFHAHLQLLGQPDRVPVRADSASSCSTTPTTRATSSSPPSERTRPRARSERQRRWGRPAAGAA